MCVYTYIYRYINTYICVYIYIYIIVFIYTMSRAPRAPGGARLRLNICICVYV